VISRLWGEDSQGRILDYLYIFSFSYLGEDSHGLGVSVHVLSKPSTPRKLKLGLDPLDPEAFPQF
jgi:hypothetical protein